MEQKKQKKRKSKRSHSLDNSLCRENTEAVVTIMKKHNVPCAIKPLKTLRSMLVHLKDKEETEQITECIPCGPK